jgi:hypothetical protein
VRALAIDDIRDHDARQRELNFTTPDGDKDAASRRRPISSIPPAADAISSTLALISGRRGNPRR